jgi:plastocyanin
VAGRWSTILIYVFIIGLMVGFMAMATGKNFLPVRLAIDLFSGGPNVEVAEPSDSGITVIISDYGYDSSGGDFFLSQKKITVVVDETVTWSNQGSDGYSVEGNGIPPSTTISPGESYSVEINRSGDYHFRVLGKSADYAQEGTIHACY